MRIPFTKMQAEQATRFIKHDEVVARTLHFGERNAHGRIIPCMS